MAKKTWNRCGEEWCDSDHPSESGDDEKADDDSEYIDALEDELREVKRDADTYHQRWLESQETVQALTKTVMRLLDEA